MSLALMRPILFAVLFLSVPLAMRAETLREWVDAAPKADITFTPWDGDSPSVDDNRQGYSNLPQNLYGHLDVSRLPVEDFPVTVRFLYDAPGPGDSVISNPGTLSQAKDSNPVGPGDVIEETVISGPEKARTIPIWNAGIPLRHMGFNYYEIVRAEIRSSSGAVLGRLQVGASAPALVRPRAVVVAEPLMSRAFTDPHTPYRNVAVVKRLVPDSYAFVNVETIWIDPATAADPNLSDDFWKEVLLGGTTVAGTPADIGVLAKRLELAENEPVLLGGLVSAASPEAFIAGQGPLSQSSGAGLVVINSASNPFSFSVQIGATMHRQLLKFSEYYLGIFFILQVAVIIVAFMRLRGAHRVWLWLVIPGFALAYTIVGIASARGIVRTRSDTSLSQVELCREGWSRSVLLTNFHEINLANQDTVLDLPFESLPFIPLPADYSIPNPDAAFVFQNNLDRAHLTIRAQPATHVEAEVRSVYASRYPVDLDSGGTLRVSYPFSGAWLWDGANWHDLGRLFPGIAVHWKTARIIHPQVSSSNRLYWDGQQQENFPSVLEPLLVDATLKTFSTAGDGIFIGTVEATAPPFGDAPLGRVHSGPSDRVASMHIVAYQFHLDGGTP